MNNEVDIYGMGDVQDGKFFSFKNVGDSIKGTYIDVREGVDTYKNEQLIYVLKDENGENWNVGVRKTNKILIDEMNAKSFGDIIGFKFDEEKESKSYPGKFAKIIRVYPYKTKGPVDEKWLAEKAELDAKLSRYNPSSTSFSNAPITAPASPQEPQGEVKPMNTSIPTDTVQKEENSAFLAIKNLAESKGLVSSDMDSATAKTVIETYAGVPLTEENYSAIIVKLTGFSK